MDSKIYTTPFDWGYVDENTLIYSNTNEEQIKEMINEALDEAMEDVKDEVIDEAISSMDIKLEGGDLLYKLIVNGNENGEINIPKDQFLKTASYDKDAKKLIFVMETTDGETTTEVNISDLVASIEEKNQEQDTELDAKADKTELETLATKDEVAAVEAKVDAIVIPDVSEFATVEALNEEAQRATSAEGELQGKDTELEAKIDQVEAKVDAIVVPDTSNLATKDEVSAAVEPLAVKAEVTEEINSAVDGLNAAIADKADKTEIPDVSGLAVKAEVTEEINAVSSALADFESQIESTVSAKADKAELETLATKDEVAAVEAKVDAIVIPDVSELATKEEVSAVDEKVDALEIPSIEGLAKSADVTAEIAAAVENKADKAELEPLATKEELENKVDWTESTPGRKHIVLKNHDSLLGTATDGTTYNVAMVSKWDVADFGSAQLHLNLNTKDGVATINDNKNIATEDYVSAAIDGLAKSDDVTAAIATAIEPLATKVEVESAAAASVAQVVAEAPEDFDTLKEIAEYIASDKTKASEIETKLNEHDSAIAAINTKDEAQDADIALKADKADLESLATKDEVAAVETKVDAIVIPDVAAAIATAIEPLAVKTEVTEEINAVSSALADYEAQTDAAIATKANTEDVYNKTEVYNKQESDERFQASGDYVPVEQYNDLKARLDNLEIMLSVYNAEREAQMDEIISNMSSDNKEVVTDTLMESIVVPETTVAYTITAPLTDNSTVELTSPKYMTLINTSKEPVSTTISHTYEEGETTSATSVYLVGDFETLTLENISPSVKSGYDAASVKNVVISENNVKNLSLALDFQDGATITNNSDKEITINNKNNSEVAMTIVAPNSTVTLSNGQFTTLNAEVSDNTLIIKKNIHIDNLNLAKGNAIVEVARAEEVAGIVENYTVADGYTLSHRFYHITNENSGKLGGVGEMILDEDITRTSSVVAPLAPAYDAVWNLNGHNITVEGTPKSGVYLNRYSSNLEVKGEGVIRAEGSYGLWNNGTTGKIIINDGVTIEAQTHAVYAEKGVIEINGGTFKLTNWADAEKDANGNLKFLINCYDANYKNGSANIIVKGGKFYDFNPAVSYGEPNGPVSFVAEGYESVMTTETIDGVEHKVYEVKPING